MMQKIVDYVNSAINDYSINSSIIRDIQGCVNQEMKVDGWISVTLSSRECVVLHFDNGVFMNQGFVMGDEKVLKVIGIHKIGAISYNEESIGEGIVDLDHGSRFEGLVLTEKEGKIGIPFGYGTSYHNNGCIEYEG